MQKLGIKREVTEAVLNHLSGTQAGIVSVYQQHDWAEETAMISDCLEALLP